MQLNARRGQKSHVSSLYIHISLRLGERSCWPFVYLPRLKVALEVLAKATGRTKTYYAREAIVEHLENMEDLYLAEQRLIDNPVRQNQHPVSRSSDAAIWYGRLT